MVGLAMFGTALIAVLRHSTNEPLRNLVAMLFVLLGVISFVVGIFVYYFSNIVLYEAGRLICAGLAGWKPLVLCVGRGETKTLFTIGDVHFQIGKSFSSGYAIAYALSPKRYRFGLMMFILGGPMASAMIAVVLLYATSLAASGEIQRNLHDIFRLLFYFQCLWIFRGFWSNGVALFETLRMTHQEVNQDCIAHSCYLALWFFERGRYDDAQRDVTRAIDASTDPKQRLAIWDSIASLPLWHWKPSLVGDALSYIDQAIAEAPDQITLQATKGGLLILGGQTDTGLSLIKTVQEKSTTPSDLELAAYFEALAHFRLGQAEKAAELLDAAIAQFPKFSLRPKIEAEIRAPARNKPQ